jgi:ribosome maturation factor RimP
VDVKLFKAVDGCKDYNGKLVGLEGNKVVITDDESNELSFDRNDVASTRLAIEF